MSAKIIVQITNTLYIHFIHAVYCHVPCGINWIEIETQWQYSISEAIVYGEQ